MIARRGSPLLIGVKTDKKLKVDFVDVEIAPEQEKALDLGTSCCSFSLKGRDLIRSSLFL